MIKRFFQDVSGLELSDYALAVALVAMGLIVAVRLLN
jgi:Flp pilus assembly pilin Flp